MNGKCYRCGTNNVEVNTFPKGEPYPNETHNLCVYCAAYGTTYMVIENREYVKTGGRGIARMFHAHDRINSKFGRMKDKVMIGKSDVIVVKKEGKVLSIGTGGFCFELDADKVVDCYANSFPPEVCKVTSLPLDTTQKRKEAVDLCQWAWDNDMYEIEEH